MFSGTSNQTFSASTNFSRTPFEGIELMYSKGALTTFCIFLVSLVMKIESDGLSHLFIQIVASRAERCI